MLLIVPNSNFRPNPLRSIYVHAVIDQALVDRLTPRILRLQHDSREPITIYIDSRGGTTVHAEMIRKLLESTDQNMSPPCRTITVVTGKASSAAADLLSFGDYAIAYPAATVFYHGVRYTVDDPLTVERASEYTESLRWRNDVFAMTLARQCIARFIFRFALARSNFEDYRKRSNKPDLSELECFNGVIGEKLSRAASRTLRFAQKRFDRYNYLIDRVINKSKRFKKYQHPKRPADVEEVVLREVISGVASRNKGHDWTFQRGGGLVQLSDDFLLLLEYLECYDGDDLQRSCSRWGNFFLSQAQQDELQAIGNEDERKNKKLDMLKPMIRPIWLFFVALCHSLQEGEENDLTATDACWLGLIDEVIGLTDPPSLRSIMEWQADPV